MGVRTLARRFSAAIRVRFRRWDEASRRDAAERARLGPSGGRGYPSREAAQPRSAPDGGMEAGGGGGDGG